MSWFDEELDGDDSTIEIPPHMGWRSWDDKIQITNRTDKVLRIVVMREVQDFELN